MATTYELIERARNLAALGSQGFDDDAGMDAWLAECDSIGASIAEKLLARRHVEAGMREQAASLKATAAQFLDRAARLAAEADRVEAGTLALLEAQVEAGGAEKVPTPDGSWCKLRVTVSRPVEILDESALPEAFVRVVKSPDKTAIGAELNLGHEVPGAVLGSRESRGVSWGK